MEGASIQLTAAVTQEDDLFVARCLDVEVTSQGGSVDEALSNLREALELYFEDHDAFESPATPIVAPIEVTLSHAA